MVGVVLEYSFKMLSPKRPVPDFCVIERSKKLKTESLKENIPPNTSEIFDKNCNSRDFEYHVKKTPKKHVEKDDPVTPNTNFKLLTSIAAGLDYANCNSPKSKMPIENTITIDSVDGIDSQMNKVNRKEKSLAIICTRFLLMYPLYPENNANIIVSLDDVGQKLGVERRRLYDIVNVFESIDMLRKLAKNKYLWFGKVNLMSALCSLKKEAENENVLAKLQYVLDHENLFESKQSCILDEVQEFTKNFEAETENSATLRSLLQPAPLSELRKEKSLAIMSQKFLMLFLVSPAKVISLGVAAKVLNGFQKTERAAQIKTQIRRLYDIANVLSSIGLIQKLITVSIYGRKPAFKYIGPTSEEFETLSNKSSNFATDISRKLKSNEPSRTQFKRFSSFQEICAVAEMEHNRICLEESANSAPPFEKSILKSDKTFNKTSFSNLLNESKDSKNTKVNNSNINSGSNPKTDVKCASLFQNILPKMCSEENKKIVSKPKPFSMPGQGNFKVLNVPKEMFSTNGAYYILNPTSNNGTKSPTPLGTLLLISPVPVSKPIETDTTTSENKDPALQKEEMAKVQQDAILQALTSQQNKLADNPPRSKSPRRNLTQLIKQMQEAEDRLNTESLLLNRLKTISKDISLDGNSSESSGVFCTRNNSPSSSRFDSPISILSGYATPVPTASFDFSNNVENPSNCGESPENLMLKNPPTEKNICPNEKSDIENKSCSAIKTSTWQTIKKLSLLNNYGSNDGINSEVADILKDKKLGDDTVKPQPFLIDEKTVFSPIKNIDDKIDRTLTPSPFITPPYAPSDTIFEFKNLELKKFQ